MSEGKRLGGRWGEGRGEGGGGGGAEWWRGGSGEWGVGSVPSQFVERPLGGNVAPQGRGKDEEADDDEPRDHVVRLQRSERDVARE